MALSHVRAGFQKIVPGLVWAFHIHDNGPPPTACRSTTRSMRRGEGWRWLHLDLANVQAGPIGSGRRVLPAAAVCDQCCRGNPHQQLHVARFRHPRSLSPICCANIEGAPATKIGHLHFMMTDRLLIRRAGIMAFVLRSIPHAKTIGGAGGLPAAPCRSAP